MCVCVCVRERERERRTRIEKGNIDISYGTNEVTVQKDRAQKWRGRKSTLLLLDCNGTF